AAVSDTPSPSPPAVPPATRRPWLPAPFNLGLGRLFRVLPAVIPAGAFLGIAWVDLGVGLNIPTTFWAGGVVTGLSVTLLFAYLALVTYVLDSAFDRRVLGPDVPRPTLFTRLILWAFPYRGAEPEPDAIRLREYMSVTFVPAVLLLAAAAVFRPAWAWWLVTPYTGDEYAEADRTLIEDRWPVLVGILLGVGLLWAAHAFGGRVFAPWLKLVARTHSLARLVASDTRWNRAVAEGLFLILAVAFAGFVLSVHQNWYYPPPVVALSMLFGLAAGLAAFIWDHARRVARLVFVGLAVWLYFCNSAAYRLQFPGLEDEYRPETKVALTDHDAPTGEWDEIHPDRRVHEWNRVVKLVDRRVGMIAPVARAEYATELARVKAVPAGDRGAEYPNIVELYFATLGQTALDEQKALDRWKENAPTLTDKGKPKLVVVTVTGGANRSALWTATVLHKLDQEKQRLPNFSRHVRLVAGASGGMVGAAYYVGSLTADGLPGDFEPKDVAQDHLTPIMSSLVFAEVPFLAIPTAYTRDRGHALDRSLEGSVPAVQQTPEWKRLGLSLNQTFEKTKEGEDAGWRPSLVFTPMTVEDGRRLFVTNRNVHYLTRSVGNILLDTPDKKSAEDWASKLTTEARASELAYAQARGMKQGLSRVSGRWSKVFDTLKTDEPQVGGNRDVYGRSGIEFFELFPDARKRFKLSTAARMNATFPYVSPAVDLPTNPPRRVVDAGYYDNYGVGVAAGWLRYWRRWLVANTSGVLVIQIRDSASHHDRRYLTRVAEGENRDQVLGEDRPPGHPARRTGADPLGWLTGPLEAADAARQTTSSFRNDELLAGLDEYFRRAKESKDEDQFFQTVVFERYSNVGMSWFLAPEDKRQIENSWKGELPNGMRNLNPKSLELLINWWNKH
ncbi:hypothetical protein J0H58_18440, partial [bacterium]|nr:hypothetical protein [bacterium]